MIAFYFSRTDFKYRLWVAFRIKYMLFLTITSAGQERKQSFMKMDGYEETGAASVDSQ